VTFLKTCGGTRKFSKMENSVVSTGVVKLPMPPLCSAFRISVESHYSLAGQALFIMTTQWPYRRFLGLRNLGFSLPPFSFVFRKQITDNCFRFCQYLIHLSKGFIKYFAQMNKMEKITFFT